ncbi:MAG: ABC transporter permease [Candidatus Paceibacterota bacterium]
MKLHRIKALFLRHLFPLQRDFDLLSDMIYWPLVDTLLWGITSQWLAEASGEANVALAILMALLLWNIIWRAQSEISRNLIDEIWNNNLVNLFSTPLMVREWLVSVMLLSILKMTFTLTIITAVVVGMWQANILFFGWWLIPFILAMVTTGWWVGFISAGIILRYGPKMQTVVWTLPGMLLPFSAVFFPLDRFPQALQIVSRLVPTTYVFETMRSVAASGVIDWRTFSLSFVFNFLYLGLAVWYFIRSMRYSVKLGLGRFN